MVEREEPERAPEGERASQNPVDSGRQDDRAGGAGGPEDSSAAPTAGEGAELIDNRESDSAAAAGESNTAEIADGPVQDAGSDHPGVPEDGAGADPGAHPDGTGQTRGAERTARTARPEAFVGAGRVPPADDEPGAKILGFRQRPSVTEADTEQATAEGLIDADEVGAEPLDLSEIQADDVLLDALGGTNPSVPAESEGSAPALESLLVAWRREVDAAPIGELVDTDAAVAAVAAGDRPRRRSRRRHLVPVASAAAVLMIGFTGVGLAARDAMPGDMLWGVAQVLYTDHARAAEAADAAHSDLDRAKGAWEEGRREEAQEALDSAYRQMQSVDPEHGLSQLQAEHRSLTARFQNADDPTESSTSRTTTSTHQTPSPTTPPPMPPPPQPSQPPVPTTPSTPSSSQEPPTTSPTSPSETTGSSDQPSSGTTGGITSDPNGWFPPN